ncbi:MAG: XF1762 family protein [Dehalococcoidia bacterium]
MQIVPVTLREARRFIGEHHRHNIPPRGCKFVAGVQSDGQLVGVVVGSRPVARALDDGLTLEVTRTCTDGTRNANSKLYGAAARAAKALGYQRLITYTLVEESGASLRASGFTVDAELASRQSWNTPGAARIRVDRDLFGNERRPTGPKLRWVRAL